MENLNIVPTILGLDLNAYSVAAAFFDAYGVKSHGFGRYKCGITEFSRIIKTEFCSGYESIDTLLPELISFAKKNEGKTLVLVPAADAYVEFVSKNAAELSKYYSFIIPKEELIKKLTDKASFYRELQRERIEFPDFIELTSDDNYQKKLLKTNFPRVLKPSCSAEYWRHPFPGMRKVYYPKDQAEAADIISEFRYYGYNSGIILQKFLENAETYVYTSFFDKNSECKFGVFGKVVLEECGKTSSGNHAAIITERRCELCDRLDVFLSRLRYTGFANFDILKSDGKFYVLELNARQGRSCDYIRSAGINIAEHLLFSLGISGKRAKEEYKKIFWHYPPEKTTLKYMKEIDRAEAGKLKKEKRSYSPLFYRKDFKFNPVRSSYVLIHERRIAKRLSKDFEGKGE